MTKEEKFNEIYQDLKKTESNYTPFMTALFLLFTLLFLSINIFVPFIGTFGLFFVVLPFLTSLIMNQFEQIQKPLQIKQKSFFKTGFLAMLRFVYRPLISFFLFLMAFLISLGVAFLGYLLIYLIGPSVDANLAFAISEIKDAIASSPNDVFTAYANALDAHSEVLYPYLLILNGLTSLAFSTVLVFGIINNIYKQLYYLTFTIDPYKTIRKGGRNFKGRFGKIVYYPLFFKKMWWLILGYIALYAGGVTLGYFLSLPLSVIFFLGTAFGLIFVISFLPYIGRVSQTLFQFYLQVEGINTINEIVTELNNNELDMRLPALFEEANIDMKKAYISMLLLLKQQLEQKNATNSANPTNYQPNEEEVVIDIEEDEKKD